MQRRQFPERSSTVTSRQYGLCWEKRAKKPRRFSRAPKSTCESPRPQAGLQPDKFSLTGTDAASANIQLQLLFPADWPQAVADTGMAQEIASPAAKGVNVSLLENVEIAVTLQFGERRLPLREIGELRSGSVIELDKYIQDPADLLLGDRVVARGEVVIVEGNYGLRITEVV